MSFRIDPAAMALIEADLARLLEEAGLEAASILDTNTSAGPRSGRQYPDLPRRSSAPGEFVQEQSGDLQASIDVQRTEDPLALKFGFFGEDQGKLSALEFGSATMEGRHSLTRTGEDPTTHDAMNKAIEGAVKP